MQVKSGLRVRGLLVFIYVVLVMAGLATLSLIGYSIYSAITHKASGF